MLRDGLVALLAVVGLFALCDAAAAELGATCSAQCDADPNTAAYCKEVCAGAKPAEERDAIDWRCVSQCRSRDGDLRDCMKRCPVGAPR